MLARNLRDLASELSICKIRSETAMSLSCDPIDIKVGWITIEMQHLSHSILFETAREVPCIVQYMAVRRGLTFKGLHCSRRFGIVSNHLYAAAELTKTFEVMKYCMQRMLPPNISELYTMTYNRAQFDLNT